MVFAAAVLSLFAAFPLAQSAGAASEVSRTILERTVIPGTNDKLRLTLLMAELVGEVFEKFHASLDLRDGHEFVRCMCLRDVARPADHRGTSGLLE